MMSQKHINVASYPNKKLTSLKKKNDIKKNSRQKQIDIAQNEIRYHKNMSTPAKKNDITKQADGNFGISNINREI